MRIESLEVRECLSFRAQVATGTLDRVSVIIGKNNAGKSNILKSMLFFREHASTIRQGGLCNFPDSMRHQCGDNGFVAHAWLRLKIKLSSQRIADIGQHILKLPGGDAAIPYFAERLEQGLFITLDSEWKQNESQVKAVCFADGDNLLSAPQNLPDTLVKQLGSHLSDIGSRTAIAVGEDLNSGVVHLGEWRNIGEPRAIGPSVIKALHSWDGAPSHERDNRKRFGAVQDLFCELAGLDNAKIIPESTGNNLNIEWNGRYLSIYSFGSGFVHLLILAFEVITKPSAVFLLEEPETHLHPEVVRRILRLAQRQVDSQFILTTHSPTLLDARAAGLVLRVSHDGEQSSIERCQTDSAAYRILDELDIRPSDLLQANAIVWVEGPSDRIFLKRIIELLAPKLSEGIDYQFAYYAGRLRAHISGVGEDADLVNVLRLGRRAAMVCDRDRDNAAEPIDATKQRLKGEFESQSNLYWVTDGREIENYIDESLASRTYQRLTGNTSLRLAVGPFDKFGVVLKAQLGEAPEGLRWAWDYDGNKVRMMNEFAKDLQDGDLDRCGLRGRVAELIRFIRGVGYPDSAKR